MALIVVVLNIVLSCAQQMFIYVTLLKSIDVAVKPTTVVDELGL